MENPDQLKIEDRLRADREVASAPPIHAGRHVLDDMDFREELAKSIGLDRVPDLDPKAFDRIKGILSEEWGEGRFDAAEAVREVRGW